MVSSAIFSNSTQTKLRRLLAELKTSDLEPIRQKEMLEQILRLLDEPD